jgi:hypothetical protein
VGIDVRQQYYRFAHQVVMHELLRDPESWWATAQTRGLAMLQQAWVTAGQDLPVQDMAAASQLRIDAVTDVPGVEALVISLPPPAAPSECYFIALVRAPGRPPRYFVAERGVDAGGSVARAFLAEWRQTPDGGVMRIHGEDLPEISARALVSAAAQECVEAHATVTAAAALAPPPGPTRAPAATPRERGMLRRLALPVFLPVALVGGLVLYLEEGVPLHMPGPAVASVAVEPGKPFTIRFKWEGPGRAFNDVWLVVDEGIHSAGEFRVSSTLRCGEHGTPYRRTIGLADRGVHDVHVIGGTVSAWLYLGHKYSMRSIKTIECSGVVEPLAGTWRRARIVVTQHQRPSDFIGG